MTDQLIPSPWPDPEFTSYPDRGRRRWAWACRGGPGCDGHTARGYDSHHQAREAWRAHVRREHRRTRPAPTPDQAADAGALAQEIAAAVDRARTTPAAQLHHGGLAQDEHGLSIQAYDDTRDYEVRLPAGEAAALAGHLIDATDPGALSLCPGGPVLHLDGAYLDGYRDAIIRVRQAVQHPGTAAEEDQ